MSKKLVAIIVSVIIACGGMSAGTGYICYQKGAESKNDVIAELQAANEELAVVNLSLQNNNEELQKESEEIYSTGEYWVDTQNDPLNIREKAKQDSKKIGKVPKGANIVVTAVSGRWGYVDYKDKSGWINLQYCSPGVNDEYEEVEYEDSETDTVYVARTGTVYHTSASCYHISGHSGVKELSRDDAEPAGLRKCYDCP